jgi:tetratricopeptide (TPR) repeat protein
MNREAAEQLLAQSRELRWSFPSSSGRPVSRNAAPWVEQAIAQRDAFARAAALLTELGEHDAALEIAANTWRLWILTRDEAGGRAFLAAVLEPPKAEEPTRALAQALYGDGLFAFRLGDLASSRARSSASLDAARGARDSESVALALLGLSRVELSDGRHERARELAAESLGLARSLDAALTQAPLHMLAQAMRLAGNYDQAAALFEESLALNRRLGDQGMVSVELHNLAHVEVRRGHVDAAERYFAECAAAGPNDDPYDVAMTLFNRATVAFARGDRTKAAALLGEARSSLAAAGVTLAGDDALELQRLERLLAE